MMASKLVSYKTYDINRPKIFLVSQILISAVFTVFMKKLSVDKLKGL